MATVFLDDGENTGVQTDASNEAEFIQEVAKAFEQHIVGRIHGEPLVEELRDRLPQMFDIVAHYRGYKNECLVQKVVSAGRARWRGEDATTTPTPQRPKVVGE